MSWYCDVAPNDPVHAPYHDEEYGFPVADEPRLLERLALEIFQAGLTWRLVLVRRPALNAAFGGFDVDRVAGFGDEDVARLLEQPGVIRNRRKILAVIENASRVRRLRATDGGFASWIERHHPRDESEWLALFRRTFCFVGPQIVREFLLSLGYLPGAHRPDCPAYARTLKAAPAWTRGSETLTREQ
jgi:DNA-3-methyladenine glycosylase I